MLFMKGNKQVKNSKMVLLVISFDGNMCSKGTLTSFFPALANGAAEAPGSYLGLIGACGHQTQSSACSHCPSIARGGVCFFLLPDCQLTGQRCSHFLVCELLSGP